MFITNIRMIERYKHSLRLADILPVRFTPSRESLQNGKKAEACHWGTLIEFN